MKNKPSDWLDNEMDQCNGEYHAAADTYHIEMPSIGDQMDVDGTRSRRPLMDVQRYFFSSEKMFRLTLNSIDLLLVVLDGHW